MRGGSHSERKVKEVMILASQFGQVWVSDVAICGFISGGNIPFV